MKGALMIAILCISKAGADFSQSQPAGYIVQVDQGEPGLPYSTIAQAIADHEDMPPEYAKFVNIEYHGVRLATMSVESMRGRSRELADELVQMAAKVHENA